MNKFWVTYLLLFISLVSFSQMQATFSKNVNTKCEGNGCEWNGPSILINEMMMSPSQYDGSLWEPNCSANSRCGEWIELYNPDICRPVDVSCYKLGNNANDGSNYPGGYTIPQGTIVPPAGFLVIRGQNAPAVPSSKLVQNGGRTVEIVVTNACLGGGNRLWFPNAGGWFAFYNASGVPQDAVSWGTSLNLGLSPCISASSGCGAIGTLASFNAIPGNRKNYVYSNSFPNSWGYSVRRIPDGGNWALNQGGNPTMGSCNSSCAILGNSTCDGNATVHITGGTPPYTYQWDDSKSQTTQTADSLCAGVYHVKVKDANGNFSTFTVTIDDFSPSVSFVPIGDYCDDNQIIPFSNYSPIPNTNQSGTFSGTGVVGNTFHVGGAGVGTFPIKYVFKNEDGCKDSVSADITIHEAPQPEIVGLNDNYCVNDQPVNFSISPAGGILTMNGSPIGTTFDIPTLGVGTYTFKYIATNQYGCKDSIIKTVTVHSLPLIDAGNDITLCKNESVVLNASNGVDYSWNNGLGSGASHTISPTNTTTYTVIGTDVYGCKNSDSVKVTVFPLPDIQTSIDDSICRNDSATIYATGGISYEWSNGLGTESSHLVSPEQTTTYVVVGKDNNGCENSAEVKITVLPLPDVKLNTNDFFLCIGDTFLLKVTGAQYYTWNNNLGNGNTHYVFPKESTTYKVIGTDAFGCVNSDSVKISIIKTIPTVDFYATNTSGCSPLHTNLVEQASNNVVGCQWVLSNGDNYSGCDIMSIDVYDTGCHDVTLKVTSDSGCVNSKTIPVYLCVYPNPTADFSISPQETYVSFDQDVVITNNSFGAVSYSWNFGDSTFSSDMQPPNHHYSTDFPNNYVITLKVTSNEGCVDSTHHIFHVKDELIYYVPNTFTPNGDEHNNLFKPIFYQGFDVNDYHLQIFDRWGEIIYESSDLNVGWDGTFQGKICPIGTYVWKIEIKEKYSGNFLKLDGHVNLIR